MGIDYIPQIITFIFLLVVISYYILFLIRVRKPKITEKFSSISVIVPTHNEERYIKDCLSSIINADFDGKKEIIVVDDGSVDNTVKIVSKNFPNVKIIQKKHTGKSDSINTAISKSKGQVIAIVDGDSYIQKDSLKYVTEEISRKNVVAASGVIKVRNRKKILGMWLHIEQIYNSLIRLVFSKVNANVVTPGPLSVYRKKALKEVGGFSVKGFSEDVDVTIILIRAGHKIGFSSKAVSETNMPLEPKWFWLQRTRFARGLIDILKKHLMLNKTWIDIYTLPLLLFNYIQAIIMGSFTIYQIVSGYITYFYAKGIIFNLATLKFFFEWFSIVGFFRWSVQAFTGQIPLNFITIIGIVSTFLTYPLYLYAILKFDKKITIWHIIPLFFMFPFWFLIMIIYIVCIPEYFRKDQHNIWKKYDP